MEKSTVKNSLVIGFAIFAMFFGAGNLIFPPFLGLMSGRSWFLSFLCFIIMDIGLSILTLLVITKLGKGTAGITEKLGKLPSLIVLSLNALCLGPLIAIPRTAATAYEFSIAPFFPSINTKVFSVFFFALVIIFCLKQTKVIDIIGTFFAPLILAALLFLIIKGILTPLGSIEITSSVQQAVSSGMNAGYQTMDVMAAMIFSASILMTVKQKGYESSRLQFKIIFRSGMIATVILFIVYGGLAYLGATASSAYPPDIDRVALLIAITKSLLGEQGLVLLGILVCAACLTPAIGLLSSAASFFEKQLNGKVKYRTLVIAFAAISCMISNFGITKILALASPVLNVLYPVLVLLVFMGLFCKYIKSDLVYRFAALGAVITSILSAFAGYTELPFNLSVLPFYQYGFQWVTPAFVFAGIGILASKCKIVPMYDSLYKAIGKITVRT